jgi:cob(I)alamin adenosyltransferase
MVEVSRRIARERVEEREVERGVPVKIYTKTGDQGMTGLLGNRRVPKDDARIEAYGTVDELNAMLGLVRTHGLDKAVDGQLAVVQGDLFVVGSALADPAPGGPFHNVITGEHIARLELAIDTLETELQPLTQFILPGGTLAAAQIHLARTICRRAERLTVKLSRQPGEDVPGSLVIYLNRLSDLLFVVARVVNHQAGVADIPWKGL